MAKKNKVGNSAKSRQNSKNKEYYKRQYWQTRKNKIKRIAQSNGDAFLDKWLREHPVLSERAGVP